MTKASWSRNEIIGLLGILFAIVACIIAVTVPEVRSWLGLDDEEKKAKRKEFEKQHKEWNNFSPGSLSGTPQIIILPFGTHFDLEKGIIDGSNWDLDYRCWQPPGETNQHEYMIARQTVQWHAVGVVDFNSIQYKRMRDADYNSTTQIFKVHGFDMPGKGFVYFIKTKEGNIAKIQILQYLREREHDPCRVLKFRYEVFPIVNDPPKPKED